jgi:hypothetical protein
MARWSQPLQDIAALTLAYDLHHLRLAQRSGACSPRLPGVEAPLATVRIMAPLGGVEWRGRLVRFVRVSRATHRD